MKRKLKLEIMNSKGDVVRTHHFFYEADDNDKLGLSVDDRKFLLKANGGLITDDRKYLNNKTKK